MRLPDFTKFKNEDELRTSLRELVREIENKMQQLDAAILAPTAFATEVVASDMTITVFYNGRKVKLLAKAL